MRLIDADIYAAEMRKKQNNCRTWKDSLDEGIELKVKAAMKCMKLGFTPFMKPIEKED